MNDSELFEKKSAGKNGMKPSNKIALAMMGSGLILFGIGAVFFNMKIDKIKAMKNDVVNSKSIAETFNAKDIENITVDTSALDITFKKSPDGKIHVNSDNAPEDLNVKSEGKELIITSKKHGWHGIKELVYDLIAWDENYNIVVQLPEKQYDIFKLDLGAGDTDISDVKCNVFTIDDGAGDVDISSFECKTLEIDSGAGDIEMRNVNCDTLQLDLSAGNFTGEQIACNTADVDNGAGDFKAERLQCRGTLKLDTAAGDAKINNSVSGGIECDNGSGDFTFSGTINGNINIDSGVGDIKFSLTNPESDFSKNGGKYTMRIDSGVGETEIEYNK